ncbi:unnamed protein product [Moneuplotes crassus]|uniref:Uncharacterized protein n=1 Tax=Euplotes crassus TaxID=5936 RepID=A0AAD1YAR6_EUPCR|nr:unnamed protein product [Moneuplotes crassus]
MENCEEIKTKKYEIGREAQLQQNVPSYFPKRIKKKGRWTNEEHSQFIDCLKRYGKDWDKLDEMIPTRDSLQIRSHSQKYFNRIKQDFNTDDPIEYIRKGMCDESPFYKFDKSKFNKAPSHPEVAEKKLSEILEESVCRKLASSHEDEALIQVSQNEEVHQEFRNIKKKRHLKHQRKYFEDSSSSEFFKDKGRNSYEKSEYRQVSTLKLMKHAQRVHRKLRKTRSHFNYSIPDPDKVYLIKKAFELSNCESKPYTSKELSQCTTKAQKVKRRKGIHESEPGIDAEYRINTERINILPKIPRHTVRMAADSMNQASSNTHVKGADLRDTRSLIFSHFQPLPAAQTYCYDQERFMSGDFQTLGQTKYHNEMRPVINPKHSWSSTHSEQQSIQSIDTSLSQLLVKSFIENYCICQR